MEEEKKKVGRPSAYTEEVATELFTRMCSGESVRSICTSEHMPAISTIMLWAANDSPKGFSERYAKACEARAHYWADEILDIADNGCNDWMERHGQDNEGWQQNGEAISRSRLRVDSRKWLLSKMLPRYADKQQLEHTGANGGPIQTATISREEYQAMIAKVKADDDC